MYVLKSITPISELSRRDQRCLDIATEQAFDSEFNTFRVGACINHSKVSFLRT